MNKLKAYSKDKSDTYYILSGRSKSGNIVGLGFYTWPHASTIPSHKAYIRLVKINKSGNLLIGLPLFVLLMKKKTYLRLF